MKNHQIIFKDIAWNETSIGAKQKTYQTGNTKIRLIQFTDQFEEKEWCQKGHIGYVLNGEMTIAFEHHEEHFVSGDGFEILAGNADKHKVIIAPHKWAELIVFELGQTLCKHN